MNLNLRKNLEKVVRRLVNGTFENLKSRKNTILKEYPNKPIAKDLFVSFTTFGPRLQVFEYTILSILAGNLLPEKILVYVPKGFYAMVMQNPNSFLKDYLNKGYLEIVEMEQDLGCHSKYYYSFQDYGQRKDIVICDDDVVYYSNWLKDLVDASNQFPEVDIFAFKAVQVYRSDNSFLPYEKWLHLSKNHQEGEKLYAEGVGGVLFKKGKLKKEVLNKEISLKITPKADDVWLWFCTHYNQLKVKYITPKNQSKLLYVIPDSQTVNLWSENTVLKRNDTYVADCHQYFKEELGFDIMNELPLPPASSKE